MRFPTIARERLKHARANARVTRARKHPRTIDSSRANDRRAPARVRARLDRVVRDSCPSVGTRRTKDCRAAAKTRDRARRAARTTARAHIRRDARDGGARRAALAPHLPPERGRRAANPLPRDRVAPPPPPRGQQRGRRLPPPVPASSDAVATPRRRTVRKDIVTRVESPDRRAERHRGCAGNPSRSPPVVAGVRHPASALAGTARAAQLIAVSV